MRRALLLTLAIAFAIACGDDITEPISGAPGNAAAAPTKAKVLFATSSTDAGLSISTDKDDYAPGETVHFTGAGWPSDDVLDILLVDDMADTLIWTVNTSEDGNFQDATYVVNELDLGVTFTLTATSRSTGASLTVQFTDGTISNATIETRNPACTTAQASGTVNSAICAHSSFTIAGNGGTAAQFRWKSPGPTGTIVQISQRSPNFPNGTTGTQTYDASFTPTSAGTWTVLLCESENTDLAPGGAAQCAGSSLRATQSFNVSPATTTTELVSSLNPSTPGQAVTFTATVKDQTPNPIGNKGSVTFYEFSASQTCDALGTATSLAGPTALSANPSGGTASFSTTSLSEGTHVITACYTGTADFIKSFASVSQTVAPIVVPTRLTVAAASGTYGGQVTLSGTLTRTSGGAAIGGKTINFRLNGSDVGTATTNATTGAATLTVYLTDNGLATGSFINQGSYPAGATPSGVAASFAGEATLDPSTGTANLMVNRRPVEVTADAVTKVYGETDVLTYKVTQGDLVGGDVFTGSLARASGESVANSPYAINQGSLALSTNYILAFVGADLTITPRPITVTADAKNKNYGDNPDPALTYQVTSGSLAFSDAFSGALTRAAGETVDGSPYAITQGTLALNANYTLTFVGANFTINPRPVTVTVDAQTKVYGDNPDPALTYKVTSGSLAFSDAFTGGLTRDAGETVSGGPYAITQGTLALNDNYALTFVSGNFTITPRPVTVTAAAKSKFFGEPDPALTYQLTSGTLVGSDAFTGALTREPGETVLGSPYQIQKGDLTLGPNYNITFVSADLVIRAWTLTGFYAPVDMPRGEMMLNSIKGGQSVPLKFEVFVGSTERTDVAVVKSFTQSLVTCPMEAATDAIEVTSTGATVLRFDAVAGQFIQNWQTPKTTGKCYRVTMTTLDDSSVYAYFKTK